MQQDLIKPLKHVDATNVDEAIELMQKHGQDATIIAGNTDEINWLKNRTRAPKVLVDLKEIDALYGIEERTDGSVRIGALESVSNVANHDLLSEAFTVFTEATGEVATPQIRNQGTIGGNLSQDSRCWYYRTGFDCYRAGGNTCYAITGDSSDHAVTDYSRCITSHPSDGAVGAAALDAEVVIEGPQGTRREPVYDFFVGPEKNITVMNDLANDEILTDIVIPPKWRDTKFYFEKVTNRDAWDFPIVNIAVAMKTSGGTVSDLRIVSNGLAPTPLRLKAAERSIRGSRLTEANAKAAGEASLPNAAPQDDNEYKIGLAANLVERALLGAK